MCRSTRFISVPVTLLLTMALLVSGETAECKNRKHAVPFKAVGVAVWDDIFSGFDPEVGAHFEGFGLGTHLGQFAQQGSLFFTGPPDEFGVIPGVGSVTLVGANGDELRFAYTGSLDSTTGIGKGDLSFTGGTGRFANVTGTGMFYAYIDLSSGPVNAPMIVWLTGGLRY